MANQITTTEDRKARAKSITGQDTTHVVSLQLKSLRDNGILIDLNVSGTGMFQKTLTWLETGINETTGDARAANFTKGMKFLYPEEVIRKIKSLESQMRQLIGSYTFQITGFHPYRWLPYTAYQEFRSKWDKLVGEFAEVKADMVANHEKYVDVTADEYTKIAEDSWKSLTSGGKYKNLIIQRGDKKQTLTKDEFISAFVSSTVAQIPSVEKIENRLTATYVTALVYGEADLAEDQLEAEEIRRRSKVKAEADDLTVRIKQEKLQQLTRKGQLDRQERELKIEAMREAELENARQQLTNMVSPFMEVFNAMRERFAEDAKAIRDSIQKNGYVRGKVAEKGRGLIELFNLMAIHDDEQLRGALIDLKKSLGPISESQPRDAEQIKDILTDIINMASDATSALTAEPTSFSYLEIDNE